MNILPSGGQIRGTVFQPSRWWVAGLVIALSPSIQIAGANLLLHELESFASNPKNPQAGLLQASDGNFYGATAFGGTEGENGTVFKMTPNGSLTVLFSFNGTDGSRPVASLTQGRDGNFYGTTASGGTNGDYGTVYRITSGGAFVSLFSFNGIDGGAPMAPLMQGSDGNLYGTTSAGGTNGDNGTLFRISTNGVFGSLRSFGGRDGSAPTAGMIQGSDGNLYGTTSAGGTRGDGTVFRITIGGAFSSLFSFDGRDGSGPAAGLTQGSDGNFYGTTQFGGAEDSGTVFRITPSGGATLLYSFRGPDGNYPLAWLTLGRDGDLYGTTSGDRAFGGTNTFGTVFRITPTGALTSLIAFNGTNGASPVAGLTLGNDGNFYGTTFEGGADGGGTLFRLVAPLSITSIVQSNAKVTLRWSSFTGGTYRVEYTATVASPNWAAAGPDVLATTNSASVTNALDPVSHRIYRVRLLP